MSDLEQILSGEQLEPTAAPAEVPEAAPSPEVPEAPEGAAEPEANTPDPEPAPEPAPEPTMVPVAVVQELRNELRALKAAQPQPPETPAPDFYEDPQGAVRHQMQPIQNEVLNMRLDMSQAMAEQQFGVDVVQKATDALAAAAQTNPGIAQSVMQAKSPYHEVVKWHQQQQVSAEIGSDPDAWKAKEREKIRAELQAEMVTEAARAKAAQPAPSMANANGVGGGAQNTFAGPTPLDDLL
jgi:hypothetical protein